MWILIRMWIRSDRHLRSADPDLDRHQNGKSDPDRHQKFKTMPTHASPRYLLYQYIGLPIFKTGNFRNCWLVPVNICIISRCVRALKSSWPVHFIVSSSLQHENLLHEVHTNGPDPWRFGVEPELGLHYTSRLRIRIWICTTVPQWLSLCRQKVFASSRITQVINESHNCR